MKAAPPRLLLLVGPTGSGKTATAIEVCRLLSGEIVSADSMQIYRGCDIVTAKPSAAEQAAARHHLIDVCEPDEAYSAARWAEDADAAIDGIAARSLVPVVAGGTGFYLRALLEPEHLAAAPPNPQVRAQLEAERKIHGNYWLHQKLQALDSAAAARIQFSDTQRVIRAIEVALSSHSTTQPPNHPTTYRAFGLAMPREELYPRLEARVDAMLAAGALDELRYLLASGVPRDASALRGVGYRQLLPALDDPAKLPEAIALWKRDTRRYAKRQMTWFRHQLPVRWLEIHPDTDPADVARQIVAQWHTSPP